MSDIVGVRLLVGAIDADGDVLDSQYVTLAVQDGAVEPNLEVTVENGTTYWVELAPFARALRFVNREYQEEQS